jgi:hypothetical protein
MLIGMVGNPGAGKDTVAGILVSELGYKRVAFADRLRIGLLGIDPFVVDNDGEVIRLSSLIKSVGWERAKREVVEVRRLLQAYGTEGGRDIFGPNCWVNVVAEEIVVRTCITDVRFPNESNFITESGGILICVRREGFDKLRGHRSEQLDYEQIADIVVDNNGTIDDLRTAVLDVLNSRYGLK